MASASSERREAVLAAAGERGASAAVLRTPPNFAWFTDGGDNRVDHASPEGVADVVVGRAGAWIVASNIEADRLAEEETPGFEVMPYPWHEGPEAVVQELTEGVPVLSDTEAPDAFAPLRRVLDDRARQRYRAVGADARAAVQEATSALAPSATEHEAAAALAAACRRRHLFAPVVLVAGAARLPRFRHPIPTAAELGAAAMLVVCAERGGLYANLTEFVLFEPPPPELAWRLDACAAVLDGLRTATRPGRTLGELFAEAQSLYAEVGFPDEWRFHHQGGITGYRSREVVATPGSPTRVEVGQAFAWNPSISGGGKAEETFLLLDTGPEVVTA